MGQHQEFGASIGKALADAGASDNAPKIAAAQFMSGAVDANARVKLPSILGNDAVRDWMQRLGVSESMMRSALTEERRSRRDRAAQEPTVKVPPKRRTRRVPTPSDAAKPIPRAGELNLGSAVVPNRSLDLL
jgi:hypothetical protein